MITMIKQFRQTSETSFQRLGLEVNTTLTKLSEGICFQHCIPKHEQQLLTFLGELKCADNFEAIKNWAYKQIIQSEALTEDHLLDEIKEKFSSKLDCMC